MNKKLVTALAVVVLVIIGAGIYASGFIHRHTQPGAPTAQPPQRQPAAPADNTITTNAASSTAQPSATAAAKPQGSIGQASIAKRYCADPKQVDVKRLADAGGLIQIFAHHKQIKSPYGCARRYLAAGGNINARDPRAQSDHLTPLLYAIQQNDLKMTRFLLAHGADPNKAGGKKNMQPYGYAIYQALGHHNENYNPIISELNTALEKQAKSSGGS